VRDAIRTLDAQSELADADDLRFGLHRLAAGILSGLGRSDEGLEEARLATAERLRASNAKLRDAWRQIIDTNDTIASYWGEILPTRAIELIQQLIDALEQEVGSPFGAATKSDLAGAYLSLSWHQLFAQRFADAQATAEKGLQLDVSDVDKALLSTNLAHALLFQGKTERAREIYEKWKSMPVDAKADNPKLFAQAVLDDFAEFDGNDMLKGIDVSAIRASMEAALVASARPGEQVKK
jgi:tetratricopeptide (TPR) repeat protein